MDCWGRRVWNGVCLGEIGGLVHAVTGRQPCGGRRGEKEKMLLDRCWLCVSSWCEEEEGS